MNIVGFNFTKIFAERRKAAVGKINITNNISLRDVKETKIGLGGNRAAISVLWAFQSKYGPDVADVKMEGEVLILEDPKKAEELIKEWKTNKRLPPALAQTVMNHVLDRCNIQSLLLSKDLNLPSPVPLPKVKVGVAKTPAKKTSVKKKK
ncbi:hypothetical protein GOV11_05295 [Candidatus Woesearchaeota archaeon]|nr:hypothetical protein [Candidatus Woesearchaeota archaeon]